MMSVIEVAISPEQPPGTFRVSVLSSPVGEATVVAELAVGELLGRRMELQQAVLASAVPSRRLLSETEQCVRDVGQALFGALLGTGEVAGRYRAAAAVAAERGEELRVVLRIDDPLLAGLPWEAMYDSSTGGYVCRREQLVRNIPLASAAPALKVDPPLRILGMVSSPRGLPMLDAGKEQALLEGALTRLTDGKLARVTWAPSATWADLQDMLLGGSWHVVHFIGHGDFDPDLDEGVLALTGPDGRADRVEAGRLVDLLHQARPMPRLVVLNSCSGATVGASDLFSGTAAALVRGGVSAVAAMQYEISDPAAVEFARGFYGAIAHGRGVDDAISSGRVAILGLSGHTLEWITPVLYLRGNDSRLFAIPAVVDRQTGDGDLPGSDRRADGPSRLVKTLTSRAGTVPNVAFSPDGRLLASAGGDHRVRLWDVATWTETRTLTGHTDWVRSVVFSPDGDLLASASDDHTVRLWDAATGTELHTLTGHPDWVLWVAFSPDGRLLASAGRDHAVRLWDAATGIQTRTLADHTEMVRSVVFKPDGRLIASASDDHTIRLWDAATGTQTLMLTGHTRSVLAVAFSPDGRLLASAGRDRTVRLWDAATGTQTLMLTGHTRPVQAVVFSPDGRLLASASDDHTVRLWDVATGTELRTLTGHTSVVRTVAFSRDGRLLASAGEDGTIRVWS